MNEPCKTCGHHPACHDSRGCTQLLYKRGCSTDCPCTETPVYVLDPPKLLAPEPPKRIRKKHLGNPRPHRPTAKVKQIMSRPNVQYRNRWTKDKDP